MNLPSQYIPVRYGSVSLQNAGESPPPERGSLQPQLRHIRVGHRRSERWPFATAPLPVLTRSRIASAVSIPTCYFSNVHKTGQLKPVDCSVTPQHPECSTKSGGASGRWLNLAMVAALHYAKMSETFNSRPNNTRGIGWPIPKTCVPPCWRMTVTVCRFGSTSQSSWAPVET